MAYAARPKGAVVSDARGLLDELVGLVSSQNDRGMVQAIVMRQM